MHEFEKTGDVEKEKWLKWPRYINTIPGFIENFGNQENKQNAACMHNSIKSGVCLQSWGSLLALPGHEFGNEETLNNLLDQEADRLTNASRYERTEARKDTRADYYKRKLLTKAGEVELKMPKLRKLPFETVIIERYKRRESSIEEALIEMYLAGVSVRRVEDITEALWGTKVSPGTASELNKKVYSHIEDWRNRPLTGTYPYVYLDGIFLKRCWGGEVENVSILVAIAVDNEGYREIIGALEGAKEDKASWLEFLRSLKERGLSGTQLFVGTYALAWSKPSVKYSLKPNTSAVWCISTAMYSQ